MTEQITNVSSFAAVASYEGQKRSLVHETKSSASPSTPSATPSSPTPNVGAGPSSPSEDDRALFGLAARSQTDSQTFAQNKEASTTSTLTREVARAYREAMEKAAKEREKAKNGDDEPKLVDEELIPEFGAKDDGETQENATFVPSSVAATQSTEAQEPLHARVAQEIRVSSDETRQQAAERRAEQLKRVEAILRHPELYGFNV